MLWDGELAAGRFVSMPMLVDLLGLPLAATREAVKRAEARDLVSVTPKRGVLVMTANPKAIRNCLDLRSILDEEGARRLIEAPATQPFDGLRHSHRIVLEAAQRDMHLNLARRAIATDLSLHDVLATGLDNPLLEERKPRVIRSRTSAAPSRSCTLAE